MFSLELVKVDSSIEGLLAYVAGEAAFHAQPFGRVFVQQLFKEIIELSLLHTFEKKLFSNIVPHFQGETNCIL